MYIYIYIHTYTYVCIYVYVHHFSSMFLSDVFLLPSIFASGKKEMEHAMEGWETKVQHEAPPDLTPSINDRYDRHPLWSYPLVNVYRTMEIMFFFFYWEN